MAMRTTTYRDPNGNLQIGYISDDNKTYTDPTLQTRIGMNSMVRADNGDVYIMGANGGEKIGNQSSAQFYGQAQSNSQSGNPMDNYAREYARLKQESIEEGLKSAYDQSSSAIGSARAALPGIYDTARNQAAGQSAVQQANFNEYAAATGLNSGTGGQAQLAYSNQLGAQLGTLNREQADKAAEYDRQQAQLTASFKSAVAQALKEGQAELALSLMQNYKDGQARMLEQQRYDMSQLQTQAQTRAQFGDFSGYAALGYPQEWIDKATAEYAKANAPVYTGDRNPRKDESIDDPPQNDGIIAKMLSFGNDASAYEYLVSLGLPSAQTERLYGFYEQQRDAQMPPSIGPDNQAAADTYINGLKRSAGTRGFNANAVRDTLAGLMEQGTFTENDVAYILGALGLA